MWMEILLTRPLSGSLNRSARSVEDAAVALFLISITFVEQDHRSIKRRVNASLGFRSFAGAQRTIQGYEAMHMIRKGQVRWLSKGDIAAQVRFIKLIFGLAAA
jgi:hypothetical protein